MLDQVEAKPRGRGAEIPLLVKLKARNLYLIENLGWDEIGTRCGWDGKSLAQTASREKWTEEKKRRKSLLIEKANARMSATSSEVIEAIASQAEEHALSAMKNVGESLQRSDEFAAKDFQAYTAGVKNLATTARLLRTETGPASDGTRLEMNLFFMQAARPGEPKQAEVVDVKQVAD